MCTWTYLLIKKKFIFTLFSPHFEKNFLMRPKKKYLSFTIYIPSPQPNQIHSKKFYVLFSLQSFLSTLFHL